MPMPTQAGHTIMGQSPKLDIVMRQEQSLIGYTITNPKYHFSYLGIRNNNYILKSDSSWNQLQNALQFCMIAKEEKCNFLFVHTDGIYSNLLKYITKKTNQSFADSSWTVGSLTNRMQTMKRFQLASRSVDTSIRDDKMYKKGSRSFRSHKTSLQRFLGLNYLVKKENQNKNPLPDIIILFNTEDTKDLVFEAKKLNIPIIAFIDTKFEYPEYCTYPIFLNSTNPHVFHTFCTYFLKIFQK